MNELALPPVVERIKRKGVSKDEIGKFVRDSVEGSEGYFSALTSRFIKALEDSVWRLIETPDDDPYWKAAPRSENLMDALAHYIESRIAVDPEDDQFAWAGIGLHAVYGMTRTFGGQRWLPIILKNPRDVRWAVDSALWVWHDCGRDETAGLLQLLRTVESKMPGFRDMLQKQAGGEDTNLAATSGLALSVMEGGSLGSGGFMAHVGDADIHDGMILKVERGDSSVRVIVRGGWVGKSLAFDFSGVDSVKSNRPEGMMLYSLSEMVAPKPFRRFIFTNWDEEEDDARLEIVARDFSMTSLDLTDLRGDESTVERRESYSSHMFFLTVFTVVLATLALIATWMVIEGYMESQALIIPWSFFLLLMSLALSRQRARLDIRGLVPSWRLYVRLRRNRALSWDTIEMDALPSDGAMPSNHLSVVYAARIGIFRMKHQFTSDTFEDRDTAVRIIRAHTVRPASTRPKGST